MARKPAWSSRPDPAGRRFDLPPPGFVAYYRVALACAMVCGPIALSLGIVGVFGALAFDDFELALRIGMGIVGLAATVVSLWIPARLILGATARRTRIRVTPAGVLVEAGISAVRRRHWLTPLKAVTVARPKLDALDRGGVVLAAAGTSVRVASGYRLEDASSLIAAIAEAVAATAPIPGDPPPSQALGPRWQDRARRLIDDIIAPIRRPTPFLIVDLAVMGGTSALAWLLAEVVDWRDAYPLSFALFIAGLAARRVDGTYIAGLRHYLHESPGWGAQYMLAAICIGLTGGVAMTPRLTLVPAFASAMVASLGLHWAMLRRARGEAVVGEKRRLDFLLALSLVPISILHEAAMFEFVVGSTRNLGSLSLSLIPVVVLFAYLPVRLHAFVDNPGDRSNTVWFWLTVIWLGLQPIIAVGGALVKELAE